MTTSFSVRVPDSRLTIKVVVYDTVREFKAWAGERSRKVMALSVSEAPRPGRCLQEIHVPRKYLSDRVPLSLVIGHEALHAACRYMERKGVLAIPIAGQVTNMDPGGPISPEEQTAMLIDSLVVRIHRQLARRKLYP